MSLNLMSFTATLHAIILNRESLIREIIHRTAIPVYAALAFGNVQALEPFRADYSFNISGLLTGTASRTLTQTDGIWQYRFSAEVASFATADEVSHFKLNSSENKMVDIQTLDHAYKSNILKEKVTFYDTARRHWITSVIVAR